MFSCCFSKPPLPQDSDVSNNTAESKDKMEKVVQLKASVDDNQTVETPGDVTKTEDLINNTSPNTASNLSEEPLETAAEVNISENPEDAALDIPTEMDETTAAIENIDLEMEVSTDEASAVNKAVGLDDPIQEEASVDDSIQEEASVDDAAPGDAGVDDAALGDAGGDDAAPEESNTHEPVQQSLGSDDVVNAELTDELESAVSDVLCSNEGPETNTPRAVPTTEANFDVSDEQKFATELKNELHASSIQDSVHSIPDYPSDGITRSNSTSLIPSLAISEANDINDRQSSMPIEMQQKEKQRPVTSRPASGKKKGGKKKARGSISREASKGSLPEWNSSSSNDKPLTPTRRHSGKTSDSAGGYCQRCVQDGVISPASCAIHKAAIIKNTKNGKSSATSKVEATKPTLKAYGAKPAKKASKNQKPSKTVSTE